jgi:hypothetical protein
MTATLHGESTPRRPRWSRTLRGCGLIVAAYVLSFGPIVGFYTSQNQPTPEPMHTIYYPLASHIQSRGVFAMPLVIYIFLWEKIFGGH